MKKILNILLFTVAVGITTVYAQDGGQIFKANCSACHSIGKGKLVGPDLKGVHENYEEAWLLKWIQSSQTLIKNGDAKAIEMTEKMPGMIMPDFALTDDEVKSVLAFISEKSEDKKEAVVAIAAPSGENASKTSTQGSVKTKSSLNIFSGSANLIVSSVIIFMMVIIIFLAMVVKRLSLVISKSEK